MTLEEKVIKAKTLGIRFVSVTHGPVGDSGPGDGKVMYFKNCWTDQQFESALDAVLARQAKEPSFLAILRRNLITC